MEQERLQSIVNFVLQSKMSADALSDNGYTELVDKIMTNPVAVVYMMNAYDMTWQTEDKDEYKQQMDELRELLSEAQRQNAPHQIIDALFDHIARMSKTRPENREYDCRNNKLETYNGISSQNQNYKSEEDEDNETLSANEPDPTYGHRGSSDGEWISAKLSQRPKSGGPVLLAGYHLAGVIEYKLGSWTRSGWNLMEEDRNPREFVILYWKEFKDVPSVAATEL